MKIYIICCVPAQIPFLGNICSWVMGQNASSQLNRRIVKLTISPEKIEEIAWFFADWCKFTKIKNW